MQCLSSVTLPPPLQLTDCPLVHRSCEIDCEDSLYTCGAGGYNCLDPAISSCEAEVLSYIADGYCDAIDGSYNNAACNWDGGDCCLATCEDSTYDCGLIGYVCNDPTASDYHTCNGLGGSHVC